MSHAVAIGNFDGVHLGHQQLLRHAAQFSNDPLAVITFWPHPICVLRPEAAPPLLTDLSSRIELLKRAGVDEVRVVQFDERVAELGPGEFVERYVAPLEPSVVVVGENFRFGKGAAGNPATLRELGGLRVESVNLRELGQEIICSSRIRQALAQGDVEQAAGQLGRHFRLQGVVVVGDQRGRELGYPTANLPVDPKLAVPADGVYAGWLTPPQGAALPAAISVGSNPTFAGVDRRVESYVLDRTDLELYGLSVAVDFVARLRGQVRFDGVEQLVAQMELDVARCRDLLLG